MKDGPKDIICQSVESENQKRTNLANLLCADSDDIFCQVMARAKRPRVDNSRGDRGPDAGESGGERIGRCRVDVHRVSGLSGGGEGGENDEGEKDDFHGLTFCFRGGEFRTAARPF